MSELKPWEVYPQMQFAADLFADYGNVDELLENARQRERLGRLAIGGDFSPATQTIALGYITAAQLEQVYLFALGYHVDARLEQLPK